MKVCPNCNAHYENDTFFCLEDGAPLVKTDSPISRDIETDKPSEETAVFPSQQTVVRIETEDQNETETTVLRKDSAITSAAQTKSNSNVFAKVFIVFIGLIAIGLGSIMGASWFYFQGKSNPRPITENQTKRTPNKQSNTPKPLNTPSEDDPFNVDVPDKTPNEIDSTGKNSSKVPSSQTGDDPDDGYESEDEPLETPTPRPVRLGKITGRLTYPSEGIPPDLNVCVREISKGTIACSNRRNSSKIIFRVNRSAVNYSVSLPAGTYYIYATVPGQRKAYFTEFVRCGMDVSCKSHRKIAIRIKEGGIVSGITLGDWYDF